MVRSPCFIPKLTSLFRMLKHRFANLCVNKYNPHLARRETKTSMPTLPLIHRYIKMQPCATALMCYTLHLCPEALSYLLLCDLFLSTRFFQKCKCVLDIFGFKKLTIWIDILFDCEMVKIRQPHNIPARNIFLRKHLVSPFTYIQI